LSHNKKMILQNWQKNLILQYRYSALCRWQILALHFENIWFWHVSPYFGLTYVLHVRPVLSLKNLKISFSRDFSRVFSSYATQNSRKKISSFFGVNLTKHFVKLISSFFARLPFLQFFFLSFTYKGSSYAKKNLKIFISRELYISIFFVCANLRNLRFLQSISFFFCHL